MGNLAKQFGIEPVFLIAQIVNFLIIFYFLKRFLFKPIQQMLKDRKNTIREGLEKAEEGRILLEKAKKEEEEILQKAHARAQKMQDQAKTQASEILKDAREQAKQDTEKMIEDAKDSIAKEATRVSDQLIGNISELSVGMLKKALQQTVSPKTQKEILTQTVKQIKKAD